MDKNAKLEVKYLNIDEIHSDDTFNCRGPIRPMDVIDLAKDILSRGLIQPITVAPYLPEDVARTGKKYRQLAGFRRLMAHRVNKMTTIAAIIREDMINEAEARIFNLAENLQRTDLSIVQEANALQRLKEIGVGEFDAADRLGKSRGWVQVRYMILGLPEEVVKEIEAGFITQSNVRELYAIYKTAGKESCFEAVKVLKDAKIKGITKMSVNPNNKNPDAKRHRQRNEIFSLQEHIQKHLGNSFATRCLAWAAGEINTTDILTDIKKQTEDLGKIYTKPEDGILM